MCDPTFTVEESNQTHFTVNVDDTRFSRSFVTTDGQCALCRGTADDFQSSLHNKLQHREGDLGRIGNTLMPIPGEDAVTHFREAEDRPVTFLPNSRDAWAPARRESET